MSGIAAIVLGIVTCIITYVKFRLPKKYHKWVPNMSGVGLGFVLVKPGSIVFEMLCGAILASLWRKYRPKSWITFGYTTAAGLTAGEAVSGLILAGFTIAGIDGGTRGTQIGCPFGSC
jgi:uncharacterized oligopeptide transporter (OPT) family protein